MQRRCTQRSCRRVFPIGRTAPVRCPYCGATYPRVLPDPHASRETYGFTLRADFTGHSGVEIRRFFPQYHGWPRCFWAQPLALGRGFSLREARQLCQSFRQAGIPTDVITTRDAQRQQLAFFRM